MDPPRHRSIAMPPYRALLLWTTSSSASRGQPGHGDANGLGPHFSVAWRASDRSRDAALYRWRSQLCTAGCSPASRLLSRALGRVLVEWSGSALRPGGRGTDALLAEVRLLVAGATRVVAEPLTVAAVGQRADLIAGEADEVALAHEPFIAYADSRVMPRGSRDRPQAPDASSNDRHNSRTAPARDFAGDCLALIAEAR
jgi:hypothetical protein